MSTFLPPATDTTAQARTLWEHLLDAPPDQLEALLAQALRDHYARQLAPLIHAVAHRKAARVQTYLRITRGAYGLHADDQCVAVLASALRNGPGLTERD